ncbi:hypothetical protein ACP4OV_011160 [Aristida adscensionis]
MGTKRKFEEVARTPRQEAAASSVHVSDGDGDGDATDGDSSLLDGVGQSRVEAIEDGKVTSVAGGVQAGGNVLVPCLCPAKLYSYDTDEVFIIVPPTKYVGIKRIVTLEQFASGIQHALFGPQNHISESTARWTDTNSPWVPPKEFFLAANEDIAVAPPTPFAIVHLRPFYSIYRRCHRAGLASLAHTEGSWLDRTTLDRFETNKGAIQCAIQKLLSQSRREPSHPVCYKCLHPAEWEASCCLTTLCSYCLPRELIASHWKGSSCVSRGKGPTTLRALEPSRVLTMHTKEGKWICTRQLLVQIEEDNSGRTCPRDIFVFRTFMLFEDIQGLMPAMRKTLFYHMNRDGSLRMVCTIGGRELRFLW